MRFEMRRHNGASLVTVMMVVAMMMALAFTVVAIAFNHLNVSFKNANNSKAKHLAEAALARAIHEVVQNQNFGNEGTAEEKTVRVTFDSLPAGSEGIVTFDEEVAADEGVPYSTNNRGEAPVSGVDGKSVPGESLHLVARARVKNSISTMEAVLVIPRFPYSIASDGAIRSNGGLIVASVKPGVTYDLNFPVHEDDLLPGHLVSNSTVGDEAIVLSGENRIYGDLQSASGVTLEEETVVLGEVRQKADTEPLPPVDIRSYDPELKSGVNFVNSSAGTLEVEGYNKSKGDLVVDNGIRLNGGVLYVEGDLLVSAGGISGKGALIATGDIVIHGDGEATSDNQAALLAEGDITLKGYSSSKAKFAGLIYTEGQLNAENLRLAGVFVAASKNTTEPGTPPGGNENDVYFKNVEVYQDSTKSKIEIKDEFVLPSFPQPSVSLYDLSIPASYDPEVLAQNLENYRNPSTEPGAPPYLFQFTSFTSETEYVTVEYVDGKPTLVPATASQQFLIDGGALGLKLWGQPVTSLAEAEALIAARLEEHLLARGEAMTEAARTAVRANARTIWHARQVGYNVSQASAEYGYFRGGIDGTGEEAPFEFSVDLSEFFNTASHMKVVYWAEYRE